MEKEETFELMPHKVFLELKKDVELLKRNPFGPRTEEIMAKIDDLSKSLALMVDAFKEANAHTQNQEVQDFSGMLNPLNSKVEAVIEQNKKIAQGILAVADIAKDALAKTSEIEMKMSSSKMEEREEFVKPLNIPIPPQSASTFMNNQGGMPNLNPMQETHMNFPAPPGSMSPPPFPNQKPMPMSSGFGGQPENKKQFKFYP